jgi:hypothetical protein
MIRTARLFRLPASLLACALVAAPTVATTVPGDSATREWEFRVLLDGDEIGYHRFELVRDGALSRVRSEASFSVRFLFFDAYKYRHENEELWQDGCLQAIDARTRVNGKSMSVRGERGSDGFVVATEDDRAVLGECIMSFAYWKPEFLEQKRLLNAQTGEYVPVRIEPETEEQLEIGGRPVPAIRYSLDAGEMAIRLWYTPEREWLALESTTEGGRLLRYEPVRAPGGTDQG